MCAEALDLASPGHSITSCDPCLLEITARRKKDEYGGGCYRESFADRWATAGAESYLK